MGFYQMEITQIVAFVQQLNSASQYILKKVGMHCEKQFELAQIKYMQFGLYRENYFNRNRHI